MAPWMDVAEQHLPQWELELEETTYQQEIADFWKTEAPEESQRVDKMIKQEEKKKADKRKTQAKIEVKAE